MLPSGGGFSMPYLLKETASQMVGNTLFPRNARELSLGGVFESIQRDRELLV